MYYFSENIFMIKLYTEWVSYQNQLLINSLAQDSQNLDAIFQERTIPSSQNNIETEQAAKKMEKIDGTSSLLREMNKQEQFKKPSDIRKKKLNRDSNFHPKKQKKDRNVISNLVHHLMKFLYQKKEVEGYLQKILRIHSLQISLGRFYQMLDMFSKMMRSYVTEKQFKELLLGKTKELRKFEEDEIRQFSKILRVVCNSFYKKQCYLSIIHSLKLAFQSKDLHYTGMRQIRVIINILSQGEELSRASLL